jgi:HD superfamily phosphodiesterase
MRRGEADALAARLLAGRRTHPERETGYAYHHGRRVGALAEALHGAAGGEGGERELVWLAGLFHDVGKGGADHAAAGAERVLRELVALVPDEDDRQRVAQWVGLHNRRGEDAPLGARAVQDADALDHAGAQQVWLNVHYSAAHDRPPREAVAYHWSAANQAYMRRLRDALSLAPARRDFDRRLALQDEFFGRFAAELDGTLTSGEEGG